MKDKLPKGWECKKLEEVGEVITGNTPPKSVVKYYLNGNIPFVKPPNLGKGIVIQTQEFITEEALTKSRLIPKNSIMVCCIGSLGKVGIAGIDLITNQQINSINFNNKIVNYRFGYYYALTLEKYMLENANQAVVSIINKSTFSKYSFPLPPLSEQKQIVSVLDKTFEKLDQAIALVEENIQKLKQLNESVLDEVYRNLDKEKVKLVSVCEFEPKKAEVKNLFDLDCSFAPMAILNERKISFYPKEIKKISEVYKGYTYFRDNDVLLAKVTPCFENGKSGVAKNLVNGIGFGSSEYYVFRPSEKILSQFIYYFISRESFLIDGAKNMSGAVGLKRVTKTFIENIEISLPSISEQQRIVAYLDQTTDKNQKLTQYYQNKLEALKRLKNSVLESAFKGALRKEKVIQFKAKSFNELYPDPYIRKNREIQKKNNARRSVLTTARIIDIHQKNNQKLGHTKVEKINHAIEYIVGYELYRDPVKDVGGPVDFYYLNKYVEPFAKEKKVFEAIKTEEGYYYETKENFNLFLDLANNELGEFNEPVNQLIQEFVFLSLRETELYMTVYAGWNNLIIRKEPVSLESIYNESITLWSNKADKFDKDDVQNAINWLNNKKYIPKGNGKEVK